MIERRAVPFALLALALLRPCDGLAVEPRPAVPNDLDMLVKALAVPGPRDRVFLDVPAALATRLAIAPTAVRSVDPGLVCAPSSKTPAMFQATLGKVGELQTVCTPAGWSQGLLTLKDGSSYVTTCGDPASARATASVGVTVGTHSWQGSFDSTSPARALSHSCSGWTKVSR